MAQSPGRPPLTCFPVVRLREWRELRGISQRELARGAEVAKNTVNLLELHRCGARADVRRKLATALGIEPHQLLTIPPDYAPIARAGDQPAPESILSNEQPWVSPWSKPAAGQRAKPL
jgi:transcriptional regulator with XRE-family HTH domain